MMDESNFTLYLGNTAENLFPDKVQSNNSESSEDSSSKWVPLDTFIGLVLAFSSCFFIGTSVIFKKLALKDIEVSLIFNM